MVQPRLALLSLVLVAAACGNKVTTGTLDFSTPTEDMSGVVADLAGADLTGVDLTGTAPDDLTTTQDLSGTSNDPIVIDLTVPGDLAGQDLTVVTTDLLQPGVDLPGADLAGADLASADLASADLAAPADQFVTLMDMVASGDLSTAASSAQIAAVRAAAATANPDGGMVADAGTGLNLPVQNVIVTFLKFNVQTEPNGFFVQADKVGPALFVSVDPSTLTPQPGLGDRVSFTVTAVAKVNGMVHATAISGLTRALVGSGLPTALQQDVSGASDLVTALDSYESELIKLDGTVTTAFTGAGAGHVNASIDTAGLAASTMKLRLNVKDRDSLDLANGCTFTLNGVMWRNFTTPQPSTWQAGDVTVKTCPAPKVVGAFADINNTSVLVFFDRQIAPGSVASNGSQFTFPNSTLTADSAIVTGNPRAVRVGTSTQVGGTVYMVTVAGSVTDKLGTQLGTSNMTSFVGYQDAATLILNEVNPNITGGRDLIELFVQTGGYIGDFTVEQDVELPLVLATLPRINVTTGDFIVVHLNPPVTTPVVTTELTGPTQCTSSACYGSRAWDVVGGTTGLTFSNRVLTIRSPSGKLQDFAPFFTTSVSTPPAAFPFELRIIQNVNPQPWLPTTCSGSPCSYMTNPAANTGAVSVDWTGCNGANTTSMQRVLGSTIPQVSGWKTSCTTPTTWGGPSL